MAVEKIQATDSLNDGRVKLNAAIEQSNEAITKATTADENASQAVTTANSVQEQFNQVVIEGDSSVEAAQARVSSTGTTYTTLKERLDQEHESVTTQLAQTETKLTGLVNIMEFESYKVAAVNGYDWAPAINQAQASLPNGGKIIFPYPNRYGIYSQVIINPYISLVGADFITLTDLNKNPVFDIYVGKNDENGLSAFKMKHSSSMSGFLINYPEQVDETATEPIPFSWAIDTTKNEGDVNTDNVHLENLMLLNPYKGINLQNAGRFNISHIYGQPIKLGIRVNEVKDVSRGQNIHFWTFKYAPTSNLYKWIKENGTAFELLYIDQLSAFDWFAFGYNKGFHIGNNFWGDLVSCTADVCENPIYLDNNINMLRVTGGTYITTNIRSSYVSTNTDVSGRIQFVNTSLYGGASIGVLISSDTGKFTFTACDLKDGTNGENGWKYSPILVQGLAEVELTNCTGINTRQVIGGQNLSINGTKRVPNDVDISPTNFNMATWTNGIPDNWTGASSSDVVQIENGISLKLIPGTSGENLTKFIQYNVPTNIKNEKDFYVIEFELDTTSATNGQFRFYLRACRSDGARLATSVGNNYPCLPKEKTKLKIPVYLGRFTDAASIRLEWQSYGTVSGDIKVTNLKWYKANITSLTNTQMENLVKDFYLDPYSFGLATRRQGVNKIVNGDGIPSSGSFTAGDMIETYATGEQGTSGNKYVVLGWRRLTTGSNNVLGTDWIELRSLTGN